MALCNEIKSPRFLAQGMASGHSPDISSGMQLERVKEDPIRLGTPTVQDETEREM